MVLLTKLAIKGIRSYSPDVVSLINFATPLTIILGPNGSGKTTIIEALKYITTNELPQNSRGGAFVHDPKVMNKQFNTASVTLEFLSKNNESVRIKRALQTTIKNNGLTHKGLEMSLSTRKITNNKDHTESSTKENDNLECDEWITRATKPADIDLHMLRYLNVSPAILENVIFCHQEEANWILSEPINVKRKFDEIFATTKYSKALDNLKKVKKETVNKFKLKNLEFKNISEKRVKKERLINEIRETNTRILEIGNEFNSMNMVHLENEIAIKEDEYRELRKMVEIYHNTLVRIGVLEDRIKHACGIDLDGVKEIAGRLRNCDTELSFLFIPNDERLSNESVNVFLESRCFSEEIMGIERSIEECKRRIVFNNETLTGVNNYLIQLPHLYARQNNALESLLSLQTKISALKDGIIAFIGDECESHDSFEKYLYKLENEEKIFEIKRECFKIDERIKNERGYLVEKQVTKTRLMEKHEENNILINGLKERINNADIKGEACNLLLTDESAIFKRKKYLLHEQIEIEEGIQIAQKILKNNEYEIYKNKLLTKTKEVSQRFKQVREYLKDRDVTDLLNHLDVTLRDISNNICNAEERVDINFFEELNFNNVLDLLNARKSDEIEAIRNMHEALHLSKHLSLSDCRFSDLKENIGKAGDQDDQNNDREPETTEVVQNNTTDKLRELDKILRLSESAKIIYTNFEKKGTERNICYLCKRFFQRDEEIKYQSSISQTIESLNNKIERINLQLNEEERKMKLTSSNENFKLYQTIYRNILYLNNFFEVFNMKEEDSLVEIIESFRILCEGLKCDEIISLLNESIFILTSVKKTIENMYIQNKEVLDMKESLVIFERILKSYIPEKNSLFQNLATKYDECSSVCTNDFLSVLTDNSSGISKNCINGEYTNIEELHNTNIKQLRDVLLNKKGEVSKLDEALFELQRNRLSENKSCDKNTLAVELSNLEIENRNIIGRINILTNEILSIEILLEELILSYDEKNNKYDNIKKQHQMSIFRLQNDIKVLRESEKSFISMEESFKAGLNNFLDSGRNQSHLFSEITTKTCGIDELNAKFQIFFRLNEESHQEIAKTNKQEISNLEAELVNLSSKLADYISITNYMNLANERDEISTLKSKISNFDPAQAENMKKLLDELRTRKEVVVKRQCFLEGELKQLTSNLKRHDYDLKNDYENIDIEYTKLYVEVKVTELIIADLDKSIKVLDKSIVQFYKIKIEEINGILKDLWINTYKGNDIDYIELKNETSDNKSYNYKMIIVKNNVEMDMRGRCSAGQKVLAGILTRLALCEAFCGDCMILALDEPTTNLDKENIESLANTLSRVLQERCAEGDFQLVLITHDERFVEMMNVESADVYYKVHKDNSGMSRIKQCRKTIS